ncbi:TnsA endonuclease N-terminal domain-containing protein [Xanthomonas sp. NCPPB 1067]|uniref:TnsA endonuclease N-terminal domain-containing protein n=1 Tax=Xanthomonas sp. NCPPB 1067 TaxID=487524 RepID=UPI001E4DE394|nr:TnsA endonuclease N-terminal domain-containing protein [Xanthomonas sp. NCPPB 1067]MCC4588334.1 TnsA endonuclease N-terminal domain-containing protein [Xanthomonas sp. NCPPB 1067]
MTTSTKSSSKNSGLPTRHGQRWSPEELGELLDGIKRGLDLDQLACNHQRSRSGISAAAARLLPEQMRPATRTHSIAVLAQYLLQQQKSPQTSATDKVPTDSVFQREPSLIQQGASASEPPASSTSGFTATIEVSSSKVQDAPTADEALLVDHTDVPMLVAVAIESLSNKRDREVLEMRLGVDSQRMTLARIGKEWGVTRERVRQIQERALKRLAARARREGTAGASLRRLINESSADSSASAPWLIEAARSGFNTALPLALKFMLRAAGFPKSEVENAIQLQCGFERSRRTETRVTASRFKAADKVANKVSQWLSQCDWPDHIRPPPPIEDLWALREVGDTDIAGSYHSDKLGRSVQYESGLELDVMSLLEKSEQVAYYQEQPAAIRYAFGKKHYDYYPDLLFATTDGRCALVEVKPTSQMALSINRAKASAARAWAHARGWGWLVMNERHTFQQVAQLGLPAEKRLSLDRELQERGSITWKDTPSLRTRYGLSTLELTAYIIQSDAELDRSYRITHRSDRALNRPDFLEGRVV